MEEKIKRIWPGWQIDRNAEDNGILGTGSFGDVFRICRSSYGFTEYAALKVITIPRDPREHNQLKKEYGSDAELSSYYDDVKKSFESEYATMAALRGHANIVYCDDIRFDSHPHDMGWDIHIKMELLTPLMQKLPIPFSEEDTRKLGMDICQALMLCQKLNIIHRDIKPQNIFLARDGNFKLGDFGIAKHMEGTQVGTVAGTQNYMAPEVTFMQPYSCQADIYSLGLVMYWMLNNYAGPFLPTDGTKPTFSQKAFAQTQRLSGKPLPPPLYGSETLKKIVLKACAFDQKQRYASAREMYKALAALDAESAVPADNSQTLRQVPTPPAVTPLGEDESTVRTSYAHPGPQDAQKLVDVLNQRQQDMKQKNTASSYAYVPPRKDAVTATPPKQAPSEPYHYVPPKQEAVTATPPKTAPSEPYHYVPPKQEAVTPTPPKKTPSEPYHYVPPKQEAVTSTPPPQRTPSETYQYVPPKQAEDVPGKQTATAGTGSTGQQTSATSQAGTTQTQTSTTTRTRTGRRGTGTEKKNPYAVHLITIAMIALIMIGIALSEMDLSPKAKETVTASVGSDYYTLLEVGTIEDPDRKLYMGSYVSDLYPTDETYESWYTYLGEKIEGYTKVSYLGSGLYAAKSETGDLNSLSLVTQEGEVLIDKDACMIEWASYQDPDDPRYLLIYTAEAETADQENYLVSVHEGYIYSRYSEGTKYSGQLRAYDTFERRYLPCQPIVRTKNDLAVCGSSVVAKNPISNAYELISSEGDALLSVPLAPTVGNGYLIAAKQGTYYVYDENGNSTYVTNSFITPATRYAPYLELGNKVMDLYGNTLIDGVNVVDYADGVFILYKDEKYGMVTTDGKVIIPQNYDYIGRKHPGYFYGKKGSQYSLLSTDGVLITGLNENPYNLTVEKDSQLFVLNSRTFGLTVPDDGYMSLTAGMAAIRSAENRLYTVYDLFTGEKLLPDEYDTVSYSAGYLYAYRNNAWTVYEVTFHQ